MIIIYNFYNKMSLNTDNMNEDIMIPSIYQNIISNNSINSIITSKNTKKNKQQLEKYIIIEINKNLKVMFLKYLLLSVILTLNFGLSLSVICDADIIIRTIGITFALLFSLLYILFNYYTYKILFTTNNIQNKA
jgi:hypothetical protein